MRKPARQAKMQAAEDKDRERLSTFRIYALFTTCTAMFLLGCEEALQSPSGDKGIAGGSELQAEAIGIIQQALSDEDPLVRANAIEVVAATKESRLMPKVQRLLYDRSVPVRFAAALAVGDLQYLLAKSSIGRLLTDKDLNVRIAAAYAISKLGHPEYFQAICKAIASKDQTVRSNAALLLGKSGHREALGFLYWALRDKDSNDKVRLNAIQAIAMLGDEGIFQKLWAMRISGYADDRVMGIQALGALGTEKAKNVLVTMLDDDILEVRLAAAEQLGALGSTAGEPKVLEVFEKNLTSGLDKKGRERVDIRTALAIGQIGTKSLRGYLPQLLQEQSKFVHIAAAKAILQCIKK